MAIIRKPYEPRERVQLVNKDPSLTKQSMKDECDINKILTKWEKTGVLNHLNTFQGDYGDYLEVQDYHTSLNQVKAAQEAFMSLPAQVRHKFENDPANFLQFVGDPANLDEMVELGLARPKKDPNDPNVTATVNPEQPVT